MAPYAFQYLIWILMGYGLVTATLLLSIGRLADIYGRVKLFRIGFLIFNIGSILLYLTPDSGSTWALELVIFRLFQAAGDAFTIANGAAIITDAFPVNERGKTLGINMVASCPGSYRAFSGRHTGNLQRRYIFLVNVPFALPGNRLKSQIIWKFEKYFGISICKGFLSKPSPNL